MDVGIHFMNLNLAGGPEQLRAHARDTAQAAEAAGCTMFTCMDHYFQMEAFTRAEDPMLEGYTTLGYVAGLTEKMTLGLLVTGVSYRWWAGTAPRSATPPSRALAPTPTSTTASQRLRSTPAWA